MPASVPDLERFVAVIDRMTERQRAALPRPRDARTTREGDRVMISATVRKLIDPERAMILIDGRKEARQTRVDRSALVPYDLETLIATAYMLGRLEA